MAFTLSMYYWQFILFCRFCYGSRVSPVSRFRDHTQWDTKQSVGLLRTNDQPDEDTSSWQKTTINPWLRRNSNTQSQKVRRSQTLPYTELPPCVREKSQQLTFKHRITSRLPFAGIIRSSSYSTSFQDKG